MHCDHENVGLTVIVAFRVGQGELKGGSHVVLSNSEGEQGCALIVKDCGWGVMLAGEYSKVMHASCQVLKYASCKADRLVMTAYCGGPVLRTEKVI